MRGKLLIGIAVACAAGALAAAAYAAVTVSFSASVSPAKAGKPTALKVSILSNDPAAEQPPIMKRIVIKLDGKAKYNASKFKRCKLSALQSKGPSGCPSGSKIGTGTGVGMAKPVVTDPVNGKLTLFNGQRTGRKDTVYVYVFPDLGPTFVSVGKISRSGGKYVLDFSIPPIKTLPSAPDASVVSVKTKVPVKRVSKRHRRYYLIVAPSRCRGSWKGSGTFYFRTGEKVTVPVSQKCKK
jgi:hypothetical protein